MVVPKSILEIPRSCVRCGLNYPHRGKCLAEGTNCNYCGKPNHWESVCRQKKRNGKGDHPKRGRGSFKPRKLQDERHVNGLTNAHVNQSDSRLNRGAEKLCFDSVYIYNINGPQKIADNQAVVNLNIVIGDQPATLKAKVDTGAEGNVLPLRIFRQICPIQIIDDVKKELDDMEKLGVIESVTEPTDWVSSVVYSQKANGKWRVCLDPKDLNSAIKRTYHKTPTLEEITHRLAHSTVFSKLDARHGYWSIMLDKESSFLTTFNSPFGRYRFKRLPFGLSVSQDIFQAKMDQILELCPGTFGISDDIGVYGKTEEEHDQNLHRLMKVAREKGLVFNYEKCEIKKPSIKFFGSIYDSQGVHPDPEKVKAIKKLKPQVTRKSFKNLWV
ncbi:hypothetical protein BSL78_23815 [Apostichopus japonicus]|uniref:Reverse transcriptase domain-containing protein n=1 Tax=Stichopus japonicus TaxID=307972 RepID=A0A2G8JUB3_STIJA|nr:hypothetical protein BSL78_23815 [Apostichopus japonicus]